jgi:dTDP-4-dehydrorhamnose 3,5-epimerase
MKHVNNPTQIVPLDLRQPPLKKDVQTVTPEGVPIQPLIHGVIIRPAVTLADDRGTLCEILNPAWNVHPAPLTYVYQFTIRPGKIKGWHVHHLHDDRIFISQGEVRVVLYDDRPDSPTYRMINEIYRTDRHRSLMIIPAFVFHAHQNIGVSDALLISSPTRTYNHADPDVFRLPIENDYIPYRFEAKLGW